MEDQGKYMICEKDIQESENLYWQITIKGGKNENLN